MKCAVGKCKQNTKKKSTCEEFGSFYSFPKNADQRALWVLFCNRTNTVNTQNERICELHFTPEDFERNLKYEMGFSNRRTLKLKPGAVPSIKANKVENNSNLFTCDEITSSMAIEIKNESTQVDIKNLEMQRDSLRRENDLLKVKVKDLSCQVQSLTFKNTNLENALRRLFTEGQIKKLQNGDRRQKFTEADIAQSITLYYTSAQAYRLLKNKHYPLPSVRTLQRWSQRQDV